MPAQAVFHDQVYGQRRSRSVVDNTNAMMKESARSTSSDLPRPISWRRAFTLVELLVVIVVLAVLAALIVPAASKAIQSSKKAACASNLRQIGAGIGLYGGEHNLRLPAQRAGMAFTQDPFWLWEGGPTFLGMLYPDYLKDYRVFYCPGQDNKNDWFLNRGIKRFESGLWGKEAILSTYVQRNADWSPPLERFAKQAVAACCRHGITLIPHGSRGPNVLYSDGSVRWLAGNQANNYRPSDTSTKDFWTAADKN